MASIRDQGMAAARLVVALSSMADVSPTLALNNAHAVELSWLEPADLAVLIAQAWYAKCSPDQTAFLLAFDQSAAYESLNFLWFRARYPRFVYVDRVCVEAAARGRGLARAMYEDLFRLAEQQGFEVVCCEVNSDPPNPASEQMHAALGFEQVGQALLPSHKTVSYLTRKLASPAQPSVV